MPLFKRKDKSRTVTTCSVAVQTDVINCTCKPNQNTMDLCEEIKDTESVASKSMVEINSVNENLNMKRGKNTSSSNIKPKENEDSSDEEPIPTPKKILKNKKAKTDKKNDSKAILPERNDLDVLKTVIHQLKNEKDLEVFELANNVSLVKTETLERNKLLLPVVDAFRRNKTVTQIFLPGIGLTSKILVQITAAISDSGKQIQKINIESNDIDEEGFLSLANLVRTSKSLKELRLANQKSLVSTASIEALISAVRENRVTTTCSLNARDPVLIRDLDKVLADNLDLVRQARVARQKSEGTFQAGMSPMMKTISELPSYERTELSFSNNFQFIQLPKLWKEETFCEYFSQNKKITDLSLIGLDLNDNFAVAFAQKVLPVCPQLKNINLARNNISGNGIAEIAKALANTSVEKFRINDQKPSITNEAEELMAKASEQNKSLVTLNVAWRGKQFRDICERNLMRNMDERRKNRVSKCLDQN